MNFTDPTGHCLQYTNDNSNAGELLNCLYAWNQLGEYYGSVTGYGDQYPADFMTYLLETASTNELINLLDGYGIEFKRSAEHAALGNGIIGDYTAISASAGIGINAKLTLIVDRFGNVYLAGGGEIGLKGFSGSLTRGWVLEGYSIQDLKVVEVDEVQLESLLTGWSMVASSGMGGGAAFIGPFGEQNEGYALTETGLYFLPQVGAGAGYSVMLYNANAGPNLLNSRFEYWYWYKYLR